MNKYTSKNMGNIHLKPCPFCGCGEGNIYLTNRTDGYAGNLVPIIFCNHCKVWVEAEDDAPYVHQDEIYNYLLNKVVSVWNRDSENL